ncbi:MAG: AIR synthase related protein, partial [Gammaproteobacteria bacterium]
MSEADIIDCLSGGYPARPDVKLGIGDDGAVLRPPPGRDLVSVLDTINEGVHFPAGITAAAIAHRALAVNLSDLAAMGAEP